MSAPSPTSAASRPIGAPLNAKPLPLRPWKLTLEHHNDGCRINRRCGFQNDGMWSGLDIPGNSTEFGGILLVC
jgi:hypothetical protein